MNKIINFLKNSIFGKFLYSIRNVYRFPNGFQILKKISSENCVILLGTPTFNNIGDHLIAESSIKFLNDLYPKHKIIEIPTQYFISNKDKIQKLIREEIPIFIVGGGWMGSIWKDDEYRMQEMISTFSNNKIVVLPQTVFYDFDKKESLNILHDAQNTYKKCSNLKLFFRDNESYELGKKYFEKYNTKVFLSPDIALYNDINNKKQFNRKKITFCMRKDREKSINLNVINIIKNYVRKNSYKISEIDTVTKYSIPIWLRKKMIKLKIKEFSQSKLIITDRLHGMIFAALTNTKCIVFDNITKKVSGVYKMWLTKNKNIMLLSNSSVELEVKNCINKILKQDENKEFWNNFIKKEFEKMKKNIIND